MAEWLFWILQSNVYFLIPEQGHAIKHCSKQFGTLLHRDQCTCPLQSQLMYCT